MTRDDIIRLRAENEALRERCEYWKQKHDDEETGVADLRAFMVAVFRCRYPAGFGWDIPRLNKVVDAIKARGNHDKG